MTRPSVERRTCPGSGMYVGLLVGHRDLCLDCGRRIRVAADYRLSKHSVPVDANGEPIKLKRPVGESETYPTREDLAKPKNKKNKRMAPRRARELCDQVFSKIVRSIGHCERCGRSDVRLECSHWITRQYSNTRCDFDNAFSMCSSCHRWWHDFPTDASDWAIEKRGRTVYDRLREAAYEPAKVDWIAELALLREIAKREGIAV